MKSLNLKAYFAECLGTFVLVFFACGVAALTFGSLVATSMAFGLVIVAMAYTVGRISGCHINPAVSLGCLLAKRMSLKDFCFYVLFQIIGAILGGVALFGICKMAGLNIGEQIGNASNGLVGIGEKAGNYIAAILVEVILTFIFVYVILNVTEEGNDGVGKKAGVLIGFTLTLVHLVGINFTGTSVNPTRSLGTAVATAIFGGGTEPLKFVWIFLVAPLLGAACAALVYKLFHKAK